MAKCCVYFWILWKSNGLSRNVSIFELLFFSDGEETKTAHRTLTPFVSSRNRRIAGPQSECPTRYISSSLFCITCRSISCTHSEQSGFSGCGIARAHAYTSFFSNSNISHGLQPPLGLPSKPWMIKTFFIVYWCPRRGEVCLEWQTESTWTKWRFEDLSQKIFWCPRRDSNPHTLRNRLLKPACLPFHHLGRLFV